MTGENEPAKITGGGEHTDSWKHSQIYNAFNPLVTDEAGKSVTEYADIAQRWSSAAELFANRIRHSSEAAWEGQAATKSREAIGNYAQRALDLSLPLQNLAQRISTAIEGVNNTKNAVDKPPDGGSWYNPRSWAVGPFHGPSSQSVRNDCENAAREAMKNHYVANFLQADQQIPVLPVPDSPTNPLYKPPENTDQPYIPGTGTDDPGGTGETGGTGGTSGTADPTEQTGEEPAGTTEDPSTTSSSSEDSSTNPASAAATEPTSTTPSGVGTPTTSSGFSGGSGGGAVGGGGGGLGGGIPGPGTGGPGRSVAGGQPGAGTGLAAAAGGGAATGKGMSGMPGMGGMGGARGKSEDEEKDRDIPEWLRNMENAEELLGPDPRTIPGGVIGGDYADPPPPTS
ncbi:WXG100 family type VII secretion target [Nocardia thraciensis]